VLPALLAPPLPRPLPPPLPATLLLLRRGRFTEAAPALIECAAEARDALGPAHPLALCAELLFAQLLWGQGRLREAEAGLAAALTACERALGLGAGGTLAVLALQGELLLQGLGEARGAVAALTRVHGGSAQGSAARGAAARALAGALERGVGASAGSAAWALELRREALAGAVRTHGWGHLLTQAAAG
jgi:hypothetical protein